MKKDPLISVILPTYHISKDLFIQCINSVKGQSYSNWEVVIVDDGNPAEYAAWLDSFVNDRIRVIHQINSGVAAARNRGGQEARGEWIYYCDPDDRMHKDELSILLEAVLVTKADIAVCQYKEVRCEYNFQPESDIHMGEYHVIDSDNKVEVLLELIAPQRSATLQYNAWLSSCALRFPWAHLYKASLARSTLFPSMHPGEDKFFNLYITEKVERIVFVLCKLHYYRIGIGVTSKLNQNLIDTSLQTHEILFNYIDKRTWPGDISREIRKAVMDEIAVVTQCLLNESQKTSDFVKRLNEYLMPSLYQQTIKDLRNPFYTRNQRLLCVLFRFKQYHLLRPLRKLQRALQDCKSS